MEGEAWMMGDLRWLIGAALRRREPAAVLRNANRDGDRRVNHLAPLRPVPCRPPATGAGPRRGVRGLRYRLAATEGFIG